MNQPVPKTKIKSFYELKILIEKLHDIDQMTPISIEMCKTENNEPGRVPVTIPSNSGETIYRKLLREGFQSVKNQEDFNDQASFNPGNEEFGGHIPTSIPPNIDRIHWIDAWIDHHLDGKREGLKVVWYLPEGKFELDPWTCVLNKSKN